jgi:hypothetical protein
MRQKSMNTQSKGTKFILTFGWVLLRLTILNAIILGLIFVIATAQNLIEGTDTFVIRFPLRLYVTTLFLANLVYVIGNTFETIYNALWDKKADIMDFEKKFFKAGLIMVLIINSAGILIYLIKFLG